MRWLWQGDKKLPDNYNENLVKEAKKNKRSDIDKARLYTASALTELGIRKEDVSITNLQAVKDKIQDISNSEKSA